MDPASAVLHYAQETFEGMKAYRREDGSVWTFRPEKNAERMVRSSHRLAFPVLEPDDFVAAVDALVTHRPALGAGRGGGEEPLHPPVHDRLRGLPRGAPRAARDVHGHRLAGRRLLQGRREAGDPVAHRGVHPRRPRRHGRGQDRRQLRQLAGRAAGGHPARLRPGGLPRRPGGAVRRGARRDEHVLRVRGRAHRHPRDRHHPRGHHPRRRSSTSPASSATRSRSASSPSTSGATA